MIGGWLAGGRFPIVGFRRTCSRSLPGPHLIYDRTRDRLTQDQDCIIYEKVFGTTFYINGVAMLSDADGMLKALKHGACFDQLLDGSDPALTPRCADLALS